MNPMENLSAKQPAAGVTPVASPAATASAASASARLLPEVVLQAGRLALGYGLKMVVQDVSFGVREGEYVCLIGRNGSGKSTLLKGILGLLPTRSGTVDLPYGLASTAFLPQNQESDGDFPATVWEVALSGSRRSGRFGFYSRDDKAAALRNLELLGIADLRRRRISDLSGGQRQRAFLARCLCGRPRLLLLDEPYTGLDYQAAEGLSALLADLSARHRIAILMSSHDLGAVQANASRVLVLDGTLLFDGDVREWLATFHKTPLAARSQACTL